MYKYPNDKLGSSRTLVNVERGTMEVNMFVLLFLSIFANPLTTDAESIEAVPQDKTIELLLKTVEDLKTTVAIQSQQIQELQARERKRDNVVEQLQTTVATLQEQCGNKISDTVKHNRPINRAGNLFDEKHPHVLNIKEPALLRRQIRQAENIAFTAYRDINIDHMAHGHVIKMNQILLNDGGAYNNTTGIFTVPVSGVYLFNFHFNSHYRKTLVGLFVDGKNEVDAIAVPKDSSQEMMGGNTAVLRVTAGQSVWLEDIITDDGEIYTTPYARYATFSGVLLYMYT